MSFAASAMHNFKLTTRPSHPGTGEKIYGSFRLNDDFYLTEAKCERRRRICTYPTETRH